jgi:hypothetical protein
MLPLDLYHVKYYCTLKRKANEKINTEKTTSRKWNARVKCVIPALRNVQFQCATWTIKPLLLLSSNFKNMVVMAASLLQRTQYHL